MNDGQRASGLHELLAPSTSSTPLMAEMRVQRRRADPLRSNRPRAIGVARSSTGESPPVASDPDRKVSPTATCPCTSIKPASADSDEWQLPVRDQEMHRLGVSPEYSAAPSVPG